METASSIQRRRTSHLFRARIQRKMENNRQCLDPIRCDRAAVKGFFRLDDCRFKKRRVYSKGDPGTLVVKQTKTSTQEANLCGAQIAITLKNNAVTVRKTN